MVARPVDPFTTRAQLAELLDSRVHTTRFVRQSYSPGADGPPLAWLDTRADLLGRAQAWRAVLEASGVTAHDRILHTLPSSSAVARDCWQAAVDVGALSTSAPHVTLDELQHVAPTVLVSTPTTVLRLAQAARGHPIALAGGPISLVVVTGEVGGTLGITRRRIEDQFGARCLDVYQLVEAGVVGWSCRIGGAMHLNEDEFTIESIEPLGEQPVDDGQLGELVLTTRTPRGTPLVRYRTGDLVQLTRAMCPCRSSALRADGGVRGRVSERLLVRGIELLPSTIEQVVRRHPAVVDYQLVVYQVRGECGAAVKIEVDAAIASESDLARVSAEVAEDVRRSLGLRLQCEVTPPGSLNDQDAGRRARRFRRQ